MHSSRMRTIRCSGHLPGEERGVCSGTGGVYPGRGSSQEDVVCLGGVSARRGV